MAVPEDEDEAPLAIYDAGHQLELDNGKPVDAGDLRVNDVWRDPSTDDTDTWWYADSVTVTGDEVEIEYSPA